MTSSVGSTSGRVLALDFDGVFVDSIREVFVVSLRAMGAVEPGCGTATERLAALGAGRGVDDYDFHADPAFESFCSLAPLGNRAEDFGVALMLHDSGNPPDDQAAYDAAYASTDAEWRGEFHRAFYAERRRLREASPEVWIGLHQPYPGFAAALHRLRDRMTLAIATAKDAASVRILLRAHGYSGLIDDRLLLDKETGVHKTHHLEEIRRLTGATFADMTFVDDKLNHLVRVRHLGVRCVLAAWGHNTEREQSAAHGLGIPAPTTGSFEQAVDPDYRGTGAER